MTDDDAANTDWTNSWIRPNLPLLIAGVLFVFVAVRVLAVTNADLNSALALLDASGTVNVALGVFLSSFSTILVALFLVLEAIRLKLRASGSERWRWVLISEIVLAVFAFFYVPFLLFLVYGFLYALTRAGIARDWRFRPNDSVAEHSASHLRTRWLEVRAPSATRSVIGSASPPPISRFATAINDFEGTHP